MARDAKEPERWHLTHGGRRHTVEISSTLTVWNLRWFIDGAEVASKKTSETTVVLDGKAHGAAVRLKLPSLNGPARQVTLYTAARATPEVAKAETRAEPGTGEPADDGVAVGGVVAGGPANGHPGKAVPRQANSSQAKPNNAKPADAKPAGVTAQAHLGLGGTDFVPEEGSKAAEREAWIREHPNQYAARRTLTAVGPILAPIVLIWLLRQITWRPHINLPRIELPKIPWPDLPTIPWPDLSFDFTFPDLPLPNLPSLPGWVQYVWPVLLAFVLAQRELRRRRTQDEERKKAEQAQSRPAGPADAETAETKTRDLPPARTTGPARTTERDSTTGPASRSAEPDRSTPPDAAIQPDRVTQPDGATRAAGSTEPGASVRPTTPASTDPDRAARPTPSP